MVSLLRQMFGLRALVLSLVAAYLLMALGFRAAQQIRWAPEGSLVEVVWARVSADVEALADG
jgi:hypothetical protein